MGLFDCLKNFKNRIDEVELAVYNGKQSFLEVYEKNLKLEAEIAARTKELDTANRQMLTLQHIWEMMNSSRPLSSVLNAIVKSLQGELGYLHSCIVKRLVDKDGEYLQFVAGSGEFFNDKFLQVFNCEPCNLRLKYPSIPEIREAIEQNKIYYSTDIKTMMKNIVTDTEFDSYEKLADSTKTKSYILIPLSYNHSHFGSLLVFSSRDEATENEINFLSLFSKQIELAITIADLFQAVKEQAITDPMTGLYNRRHFEEFIKKEAVRANRLNQKFTVIGIDLDHLKKINDDYGHNYGDIAIKAIAGVLKSSCRSIDIAARMGGEEFNVILSGVDSQGGMVFAERIRKTIKSLNLEKIGHITASLGVATYMEHSDDIDELLELVDHAMYQSKKEGRDRVSLAQPLSEASWQEVAVDTYINILNKHKIPIDGKIADTLCNKLKESGANKDMIYNITDMLVSTYNPEYEEGFTRKKVLMATSLAKRLELPKESIDKLKIAILLYDIGNTMLPKELLNKKDPLTEEELLSIKKHPVIAAREILEPITAIGDIIPIIEKHHENWNGSGYPNNLSGDNIPIESQIILIVDSYFALLQKRPYREAMSKENALNTIMSEADSKWSKHLAEEFINMVKNYED